MATATTASAAKKAATAATQAKHAVSNVAEAAEIVGEDAVQVVFSPVRYISNKQGVVLVVASSVATIAAMKGLEAFKESKIRRRAVAQAKSTIVENAISPVE